MRLPEGIGSRPGKADDGSTPFGIILGSNPSSGY